MNFALAAGGTGGHMIPAHALAAELKSRGHGVLLITDERGARFPALFGDMPVHILPAGRLGGGPIGWLKAAASVIKGRGQAKRLYREHRPDAVVGSAGGERCTIFRPRALGQSAHPVVLWGNGTGAQPVNYKEILQASGIDLELRTSSGGVENLQRLNDNAVQVGWCKSNPNSDAMKQLGGYNIKAKAAEIGGWGARRHAPAEEDGRQGDGDTVRAEHSDEDG